MSETLTRMIKSKKGYRTENYSGSLTRDLYDVIRHEISMGNTDIIFYVQDNYHILNEYVLEENQINELKQNYTGEEYTQEYWARFSEMCQENSVFITEEIIEYIAEKLSTSSKNLTGLWLSTYDNVVRIYNYGSKEDIDEYPLTEQSYIVISDLGQDGALFVFNN